jgi:hypothetical protein
VGDVETFPALTAAGTYQLLIRPTGQYALTGTAKVLLDPGITAPMDGTAVAGSITQAGGSARYNFNATSGQRLGIGLTNLAFTPGSVTSLTYTVYRPDGSLWYSDTCNTSGSGCADYMTPTQTGVHSVVVTPASGATATFNLWLSTSKVDTLVEGAPYDLSLDVPGQNAWLSFTGSVGQVPVINVAGLSSALASRGLYISLISPSGVWTNWSASGVGDVETFPALTAAGTYRLLIRPTGQYALTGTAKVLLDPGIATPTDGTAVAGSITLAGGSARYNFSGTSGQRLGIGFTNLAFTPSSVTSLSYTVYYPGGGTWYSATCNTSGSGCADYLTLTQTGTYSVVVTPSSGAIATFNLWLPASKVDTLVAGTPYDLSFDVPGQNAWLSFTGAVGQVPVINVSALSSALASRGLNISLISPSGVWTNWSTSGVADVEVFPALTAAGTYRLLIRPSGQYALTGTAKVLLDPGIATPTDGTAVAGSITQAGGSARYNFSGTSGQRLGIGFTNLVFSPISVTALAYTVYYPNGSSWYSDTCNASGSRCADYLTLTQTGTYSVVVTPSSGATATFNLWLPASKVDTLVAGTPYDLSLDVPGQNAWLSFTGSVGQVPVINVSALSSALASRGLAITLYPPSGGTTSWTVSGVGSSKTLSALTASGTYRLLIRPAGQYPDMGTTTITLQ